MFDLRAEDSCSWPDFSLRNWIEVKPRVLFSNSCRFGWQPTRFCLSHVNGGVTFIAAWHRRTRLLHCCCAECDGRKHALVFRAVVCKLPHSSSRAKLPAWFIKARRGGRSRHVIRWRLPGVRTDFSFWSKLVGFKAHCCYRTKLGVGSWCRFVWCWWCCWRSWFCRGNIQGSWPLKQAAKNRSFWNEDSDWKLALLTPKSLWRGSSIKTEINPRMLFVAWPFRSELLIARSSRLSKVELFFS